MGPMDLIYKPTRAGARSQRLVVVFVYSAVYYTVDEGANKRDSKARSLRHIKKKVHSQSHEHLDIGGTPGTSHAYASSMRSVRRVWETIMPESLTVRISRSAHATLRSLSEETDESMTEVLDKAIEAYRRARFLAGLNGDFAALRQNRAAWEEEQQERKAWDVTLADGLED